tara:strand:+ start:12311 stop:12475 length:165 start_codon:yes stop_codon:yes gene_type:complete
MVRISSTTIFDSIKEVKKHVEKQNIDDDRYILVSCNYGDVMFEKRKGKIKRVFI